MPDITEFPIPTIGIEDAAGFQQTVNENNTINNVTNNTNVEGGNYISSTGTTDIDDLITTMGSSGLPAILDDTKDAAAAKVFPATAQIKPGGGKFTQSASGTLTFQGPGIVGDTHEHIIEGYAAEEIQWTGKYPQFFRPEWFGMVSGDSSAPVRAANSAAWVVLMAALRSGDTDGLGGNWDPYLAGADIHFSKGNYYVDTVLQVNTQCRIYIPHGCQIIAGSNASAFRTNGQLTRDEGALDAADRTGAEGTIFYGGGAIRGTAGAATHNITLSVLTVTKLSGVDFNYQEGFLDGYTFTDTRNGVSYVIIGNPASTTSLTIRPYKLYLTRTAPNTYTYYGIAAAPAAWVGATIVINGTSTTISAIQPAGSTSITTADDIALSAPATCSITSFPVANFTAFDARFNRYPGIDCRARTTIEGVTVSGFPGHGVAFDSVRNPSTAHGTQPNQNNSVVRDVHSISNHGAGFYSKAVNANNIAFTSIDTQLNRIGIFDAPQHANYYAPIHCALDVECVIQKDSVQGSVFDKPYIEEGTPNWDCDNAVIGPGTYDQGRGGGIQQYALGGYLTGAPIDTRVITSALGTVSALVKLVVRLGTSFNGFFQFGQVNASAVVVKSYHLMHYLAGKYSLAYYENDSSDNPITDAHDPVLEFTTSDHALGGGFIGFPKGVLIGDPGTRPAASADLRGYLFCERGGAGVADVLSIVIKNASDAYAWLDLGGGGGGGTTLLTADLDSGASYTSNTTLANTALEVDVEAGTTYYVQVDLLVDNHNGGFKMDFDGGDATYTAFLLAAESAPLTTSAASVTGVALWDLTALDFVLAAIASVTTTRVTVRGRIVVDDAGTFIMRGAQNASHADTTVLKAGSTMVLTPM